MGWGKALFMVGALAATGGAVLAAQPETSSSDIGYPSVAAALSALRARADAGADAGADVRIWDNAGWTIVDDQAAHTLWSFTPPGHPAHPAAVARTLSERDGGLYLKMRAKCEASKPACDDLWAQFERMNERMRR